MNANPPSSIVPDFHARQAMWSSIDFAPVPDAFPAVERYVQELSVLYANGAVKHAAFRIPVHPVFEWYASRNQFHESGFFERFWKCPSPCKAFPHELLDLNFFDSKVFSFCSPFHLGGSLAWTLFSGGAYKSFEKGGVEAKRIGDDASIELLAGDYDGVSVYDCTSAWSEFFRDVAWDRTFVVIHRPRALIHVLIATDTD